MFDVEYHLNGPGACRYIVWEIGVCPVSAPDMTMRVLVTADSIEEAKDKAIQCYAGGLNAAAGVATHLDTFGRISDKEKRGFRVRSVSRRGYAAAPM